MEQMVLDGLFGTLVKICLEKWCTIDDYFPHWDINYTLMVHKFRQLGDY